MKKALERNKQNPDIASIAYKVKCIEPLHQTHDKKLIKLHLELLFHPLNFSCMFTVKKNQYVFPSCKDGLMVLTCMGAKNSIRDATSLQVLCLTY